MTRSRQDNLKRLIKLAHKVRKEVQEHASHHYPSENLWGACGTASFKLMKEARYNGIKVRLVHGFYYSTEKQSKKRDGQSHCWIEYDGHIIDVTATQFRFVPPTAKVLVSPQDSIHYEKRHEKYTMRDAWDLIGSWAMFPKALEKNHLVVR